MFVNNTCFSTGNDADLLWHNKLGHVPFVKMKNIQYLPVQFSSRQAFLCTIFPMARQARLPFDQSTTHTKKIFKLLHVDLWGLYHTMKHDKYKYFITMVDDYSRST